MTYKRINILINFTILKLQKVNKPFNTNHKQKNHIYIIYEIYLLKHLLFLLIHPL